MDYKEQEFNINEELKKVPDLPGVYIMRDEGGGVIYVGKSKTLKNRVRSYFQHSNADQPKNKAMVPLIKWFEYIVTDNESEALILECNLIKKHRPRFNVLLKDDRTYPYIKLTVHEGFPRVFITRHMVKDGAKYYGPYPAGYSVTEVMNLIRQIWPLRMCDKEVLSGIENSGRKGRPCLNHHMGLCKAPCDESVSREDYQAMVVELTEFLSGKHGDILKKLEADMFQASEELEFEKAAVIRNRIFAVKNLANKQKLDKSYGDSRDIAAFAKINDEAMAQVFYVRDGKMIGRERHMLKGVESMPDGEIMYSFIMQFYNENPEIPPEIVLETDIEDREAVAAFLSKQRGSKVLITVPQKGEKAKLAALAKQNAVIALERYGDAERREWNKSQGALKEISKALGINIAERAFARIEAYDISNTQGVESVGSMVVFEQGKPKRTDYRKFKIKTVVGADDYASMDEVLTRRFLRYFKEKQDGTAAEGKTGEKTSEKTIEKSGEEGKFSVLPDVLFIDGGKGQVAAAESVLEKLSLSIPVCGMIKDDKHRTRGLLFRGEEVLLPKTGEGFKLITRIQDEVHRFAVEYHRKLREKAMVKSELDDIKGVGAARKKALMKHFGAVEEIRKASVEELCAVDTVNRPSAQAVYDYFHNHE